MYIKKLMIMNGSINFTEKKFPQMNIKIGDQVYLQNFYESLGFKTANEGYDEDGIPHIDMIRTSIINKDNNA